MSNWHARRLGGSSTGFPDIVAVNNSKRRLLTIEAKAGTSDNLYVPPDQIERCRKVLDIFGLYESRFAILAFKFMNKRRTKNGESGYEHRDVHEYYKVANDLFMKEIPTVRCSYDGRTFVIVDESAKAVKLPDYVMPFQKSIQRVAARNR